MRSGLPGPPTDAGKTARIGMHQCECRNVTVLAGEAERAIQHASRFIDFPERPQDQSEPSHGDDSVIIDEPGVSRLIRLVVTGRESLFKMCPRAAVIPLEPASYSKDVQCPALP